MLLLLKGTYGSEPASLLLQFTTIERDHVHGVLRATITSDEIDIKCPFVYLGHDILRFLHELTTLHRRHQGTAHLVNSGEADLRFRVIDPHRIVVGGKLEVPGWLDVPDLGIFSGKGFTDGLIVSFAGLELPLTVLPEMITALQTFLDEKRPDMTDPWKRAAPPPTKKPAGRKKKPPEE